jgi:AAA domain
VNEGIDNIIRVGGQSKSTILANKNLRIRSQSEAKTIAERSILRETISRLEEYEEMIAHKIRLLRDIGNHEWHATGIYLQNTYPQVYSQFVTDSNGNYATGGAGDAFAQWRLGSPLRTVDEPEEAMEMILKKANKDIHQLSNPSRHRLLKCWMSQIFSHTGKEIFELLKSNNEQKQHRSNVYGEIDRRCLKNADVIGVTTAGFALRISILRHIDAKLTICEEAGQILEGHLLSALLPSLEHLIQIGDHSQLRPPINDYKLSTEGPYGSHYQLDRSMFERLSTSNHRKPPLSFLNVQRRMRPDISRLLKGTIYPELIDHESVKNIPDVVGMRKSVYWLHHTNQEDGFGGVGVQKSYSNDWEVEIIHKLVRHIVRQGVYSLDDIAILTPYSEQEHKLKVKLWQDYNVFSGGDDQLLVPEAANGGLGQKIYQRFRISTM